MTRRLLITAVIAATALAGCGKATDTVTTSTTATVSTAPAAVPTTATPSTAPSGAVTESAVPQTATESTTTTTTASPSASRTQAQSATGSLPTRPGAYADAAINAVSAKDTAKAAQYLSPTALAGLKGASMPTAPLMRNICEDDMCSYTSEDGKRITVTFDLAKVKKGQTGGITKVKIA